MDNQVTRPKRDKEEERETETDAERMKEKEREQGKNAIFINDRSANEVGKRKFTSAMKLSKSKKNKK